MKYILGFICLALIWLSGCNGQAPAITCQGGCPPGMIRDLFCKCFKPEDYSKKAPGSGTNNPTTISAACVCLEPNGHYAAWFRFEPPGFSSIVGKNVFISAGACEDTTVCPVLDPATDRIVVWRGSGTMRVVETDKIDNYVYGKTSWVLHGPISERSSLNTKRDLLASSSAYLPAETDSDEARLDCQKHCKAPDEYCLSTGLIDEAFKKGASSLLNNLLSDKPVFLQKANLMGKFGVNSDPCNRGDTYLQDGFLQNKGGECTLSMNVNVFGDSLGIRLYMPPEIKGKLDYADSNIKVEFSETLTAPEIGFSDADLQLTFGGELRQIQFSSSSLLMETYNGCIEIKN